MPRALKRPWSKVVAWQFNHIWDGSAISAWQAKTRDDGLIGFEDIAPRPMSSITEWDITQADGFRGVWQANPWEHGGDLYIPRGRMVYTGGTGVQLPDDASDADIDDATTTFETGTAAFEALDAADIPREGCEARLMFVQR